MRIRELASKFGLEFGNIPTPEQMASWREQRGLPEQAVFDFVGQDLDGGAIAARQEILKSLDLYATEG